MANPSSVAVFCGSSNRIDQHYIDMATQVGTALGSRGIRVVYGGGHSGLMGAVAAATMQAGGEVIGVIPRGLFTNGIDADGITSLEVVDDMHQRKARMYELADGFIGLPGGFGTFEEVFEAATWTQLGLHADGPKPVVLLDTDQFWKPIHDLIDHANSAGFISDTNRQIIAGASSIEQALTLLATPPAHETPEFVRP